MNGTFHPMTPILEVPSSSPSTVTGQEDESGGSEINEEDEDPAVNESLLEVTVMRPHEKTRFVTFYVIVASMLAALGGVLFGYDVGIVSGALLQLTRNFQLSCLQQEMVVSAMLLGALIASFTGGFLVDYVGRRKTIICNSVVFIVGAVILTCAQNFPTLVVGRLILGFGVSLSAIAECVYITEIAPPNQRGLLVSLNELGITLGFLTAYLINLAFIRIDDGWRYMFGLSMVPAVLQGVGMVFLPSSPRFLMLHRKEEQARNMLVKLRGTEDVDAEIRAIGDSLISQQAGRVFDLCSSKDNMWFRFVLGLGLVFFQQFTGQPSVLYYAPTIFHSVGFGSDSAAMIATVGLGVVKVIFTTVALLCVDCAGRRKFLISGTVMMLVGIACLGFTALTQNSTAGLTNGCHRSPQLASQSLRNSSTPSVITFRQGHSLTGEIASDQSPRVKRDHSLAFPFQLASDNETFGNTIIVPVENMGAPIKWMSFLALVVYTAGYALGFGPVSWLVLSEIFPSPIRGRAISLATVANWGTNLVVSFTFLDLMSAISLSGTFLLYAAIGAVALLYIFFLVPETKGRTLEEISSHLDQSYIAGKLTCCRQRPVSRLQFGDDCDMNEPPMSPSARTNMSYSLLASE